MEINETSSTRPYYRRKLFLATFVTALLGGLCLAAGLHALFPAALGARYGAAILTLRNIEQTLVPRAAGLFAVMTGLLVPAVVILHLFYSHRIAGPAFRIGREAERIGKGDLKADFKLRRKDNLTDLGDALKETARRYRETVIAMERHASGMQELADGLRETERGPDPAALASTLRELTSAVEKTEKMLSGIRT